MSSNPMRLQSKPGSIHRAKSLQKLLKSLQVTIPKTATKLIKQICLRYGKDIICLVILHQLPFALSNKLNISVSSYKRLRKVSSILKPAPVCKLLPILKTGNIKFLSRTSYFAYGHIVTLISVSNQQLLLSQHVKG